MTESIAVIVKIPCIAKQPCQSPVGCPPSSSIYFDMCFVDSNSRYSDVLVTPS